MNNVTIWHNPRCSKSRETLALLQKHGHEPRVIRYLESAPSEADLRKVLALLDYQPRELIRTKEKLYSELGLADVKDDEALISAMVENPKLIERPIVISDRGAAIGRPPENVLQVLE